MESRQYFYAVMYGHRTMWEDKRGIFCTLLLIRNEADFNVVFVVVKTSSGSSKTVYNLKCNFPSQSVMVLMNGLNSSRVNCFFIE
jgi:hypothetical protein